MKRIIYKSIAVSVLALITCLFACTKNNLEQVPVEKLTKNLVFDPTDSLGDYAKNFLNDVYTYLPNGYNRISNDVLDAGSDDAITSQISSPIQRFSNGQLTPSNTVDDSWGSSYTGIRKANIFLANIDVVPLIATQDKIYYKAEARFIRAMCYFELVKRYGGVPLLGDKVLALTDNLNIPRNTLTECTNYILSECDAITGLLRPDLPSSTGGFVGRITQTAPLALKSRLLLYLASPLYNPGNDLTKWQAAANAANAIISQNIFTLSPSFSTLFTTRSNSEVILAYQRALTTDVEQNNGPVGYASSSITARGYTSPTQDLVNAFGMANGKAIGDAGSGYNAANPYAGRDPRLQLTVFYNGLNWLNRPVETFDGGKDRPGGVALQTRTGYYMKKFMANFATATTYSNQTHNFIIFRYAEILLNFAEAQNEATGPTPAVYAAVESIRKRAGLVPFALPIGLTQAQMRAAIWNERRVEMAFEEQRFWDIRRWKIAEVVLNGTLRGIEITKDPVTSALTYQVVNAATVSFDAGKMYSYPISYSEITKNTALVQNPGW